MITGQPFPWAKYGPTLQWCRVCGTTVWFPSNPVADEDLDAVRCERHQRSNACAIEGCKRSTKAGKRWFGINLWLCSEHWRLIAPRSPERKIYHRIFRLAKRYGWSEALIARYWRIWNALVSRARARARGDVDMDEINRVMGW
jgi:hypothetical protein